MDEKEAIKSVGEILANFLKTGPNSPTRIDEIDAQIFDIVLPFIPTPDEATEDYIATCKDFLDSVVKARGMPTRAIATVDIEGGKNRPRKISASGDGVRKDFNKLRPKIISRYNWCIENYKLQSKSYFDRLLAEFHDSLLAFLKQVPIGGTKDKEIKSEISKIKKEFRALTNWPQYIYTSKMCSLTFEIEHIFAVHGGAIAAEWHWSSYRCDLSEHEARDGKVYLVRDNWAEEKGLCEPGKNGYTEQISAPHEENGCMCDYSYLHALRDLPDDNLTPPGRAELLRANQALSNFLGNKVTGAKATKSETRSSGLISRFAHWLGLCD